MSLTKNEQHALLALAGEYEENPRPVSTLIVMAACNARAGHQQDAMLVALSSLKRQELVEMRGDAWWPTWAGRRAVHMIKTGTVPATPEPEPLAEAPPVRPKSCDTLRPRQTTAPKPVTRPDPAPAADPDPVPEEAAADCRTPLAADRRETCAGCGRRLTEEEARFYEHHCEECEREAHAALQEDREPSPSWVGWDMAEKPDTTIQAWFELSTVPPELINRCAAMQLALLADARQRYDQGDHEAAGEICWLLETGEQLLAAGGL